MIEFSGVEKTYDTGGVPVHALRATDLGVGEGDFVAVMAVGVGQEHILDHPGRHEPADAGAGSGRRYRRLRA